MNRLRSAIRRVASTILPTVSVVSLCLLAGCVTLTPAARDKPGPKAPPPESQFTKLTISVPTSDRVYPTWRTKSYGKPILLLHPVNGLSPDLLDFALELEDWGYRVYLPSLYGDPILGDPAYGYDKGLGSIKVIRKEGNWNPVSTETMGPIVDDIAALARSISRREGRSIAVIGNSFTGNIPLALLGEPSVRLAVLAQPAMPVKRVPQIMLRVPQSKEKRSSLALSEEDWTRTISALRRNRSKRIVGFHYTNDPMAPIEKFDALHERLADAGLANRFTAYVLAPDQSEYIEERSSWVVGNTTREKKKILTPHSTYISPENPEDREWFRKQLKTALGKVWW